MGIWRMGGFAFILLLHSLLLGESNSKQQQTTPDYTAFGCNVVTVEQHGKVNAPEDPLRGVAKAKLRSNANCNILDYAYVGGDVEAGPTGEVIVDPEATVTGETGNAAMPLVCNPIDLESLAVSMQSDNDNSQIPLTEQGREALNKKGELVVIGNDTLILPPGDYYVKALKVVGTSTLNVSGQVTLFVDGPVDVDGTSSLNPGKSPYYVTIYTTTDIVMFGGTSEISANFYVPDGIFKLFGEAELTTGVVFADEVIITGNATVNNLTDNEPPAIYIVTEPGPITPPWIPAIRIYNLNDYTSTITINGQPYEDGQFFTQLGTYTVHVEATDMLGYSSELTQDVTVECDFDVRITNPAPGAIVTEVNPLIQGTFETCRRGTGGPNQLGITVNGDPVLMNWDDNVSGTWMTRGLFLQPGVNEFCVDYSKELCEL